MPSPDDLLKKTASRLQDVYGVNARLDAAIETAERGGYQVSVFETAQLAIEGRREQLKAARKELRRLQGDLDNLRDTFAFTPAGWVVARDEVLSRSPEAGVDLAACWLEHWFDAAGRMRLDTLAALESDGALLGEGFALLLDHAAIARKALSARDWNLSSPLLTVGEGGVELAGRTVPGDDTRIRLGLMQARLALNAAQTAAPVPDAGRVDAGGRPSVAGDGPSVVEGASVAGLSGADGLSGSVLALRAWQARLAGDDVAAASLLEDARAADPTNLDVALQLILVARQERRWDAALDAAEVALNAVGSLVDIDNTLDGLVSDATAELWVAAAARLSDEGDPVRALDALDRAKRAAAWQDYELLAVIFESQAELLRAVGRPPAEVAEAFRNAGSNRLWAQQAERAREHFEEAFGIDGSDPATRLSLAQCLSFISYRLPVASAQPLLARGLDLVAGVPLATPDNSWGYLVEADLSSQQARVAQSGRTERKIQALQAAAKALAFQPNVGRRWTLLAEALSDLGLVGSADVLSRHSLNIGRALDSVASRIRSLMEQGRCIDAVSLLDESMKLFEDENRDWADGVRGFALLKLGGDPMDAVRILRGVTLSTSAEWVYSALIGGLLLAGERDPAVAAAQSAWAAVESKLDEYGPLVVAVLATTVLGDLDRALALSQQVLALSAERRTARSALNNVATVQALRNDVEAAMEAFAESIKEATVKAEIEDWPIIDRPMLERLVSADAGIRSRLDEVDRMVAARLAELPRTPDPLGELSCVFGAQENSGSTLALLKALVLLAGNDDEGARAALEVWRDEDHAAASLYEHVAARLVAAGAVGSDDKPQSADDAPPVFELHLPPSWFDGHPDPLNSHSLFVRFLPEMRERANWNVPGIAVRTDPDLEPDGYEILVHGVPAEDGRVDPKARYATVAGANTLGAEFDAAGSYSLMGLVVLRTDEFQASAGLMELLTMTPVEVVALRIGAVADDRATEIGGSSLTIA